MNSLELVKLTALMSLTSGEPAVKIGLIDGSVDTKHPDLTEENVNALQEGGDQCTQIDDVSCMHGTFVAGILSARRTSSAPAICPACTLMIRPIFTAETVSDLLRPSATPQELATAIVECIDAGAHVLNMSIGLDHPSMNGDRVLEEALDYALARHVLVVAAAGNQGTLGSSAITRHPWVIPVAACDVRGRPMRDSNLGVSIGRRGLSAPGDHIASLSLDRRPLTLSGTSLAAPFVTGTIALLWSAFPGATAAQVKRAVVPSTARRTSVVPPVLNAEQAYQSLSSPDARR